MKDSLKILIAAVGILLITFSTQAYAVPTGASTQVTEETRYNPVAGTTTSEGGNVTGVNITGNQVTSRWAGFFGNISGGIVLKDSAGSSFFEWTVNNVTGGTVYATNATVTNWGTLAAAASTDMYSFLSIKATDNYTNTYNESEARNFSSSEITAKFAYTWEGGSKGTKLKSYSLKADTTTLVWAGAAEEQATGFNSKTLDYQILVPVSSTALTYNFYLELP